MDTAIERPDRIIASDNALHVDREAVLVGKSCRVDIDRMEVVATSWSAISLRNGIVLIDVRLCSKVPGVCVWIKHTSRCDTNRRVDINTAVKVSRQEWPVHISLCHNNTSLCIKLVDVVLGCCNKDVLYTVVQCQQQRLREDLFRNLVVALGPCSWQVCNPQLAERRASNDRRIHVVRRLVSRPRCISSPSDRVPWLQLTCINCITKERDIQNEREKE